MTKGLRNRKPFGCCNQHTATNMTETQGKPVRRDELTSLFSLCGTLSGLCIGIVAFVNASGKSPATVVDDVLASCASAFLLCIYLIAWALRTSAHHRAVVLAQVIEVLFLVTLTVMTVAGFVMVYTIW